MEEYYAFDACDRMDLVHRSEGTASDSLKAHSQRTVHLTHRVEPTIGSDIRPRAAKQVEAVGNQLAHSRLCFRSQFPSQRLLPPD